MSLTTDILLTMSRNEDGESPTIGTAHAAISAYTRFKVDGTDDLSAAGIADLLPLLVAYGLLGAQPPQEIAESDAEAVCLRVGALVCHASWRDCQSRAHVSVGKRLVVGVPRIYTHGPIGTTFAVPHPSTYTKRRIGRFSAWAVGLLAPVHKAAWLEAALGGDPVAGAAVAVVANGRASGEMHV